MNRSAFKAAARTVGIVVGQSRTDLRRGIGVRLDAGQRSQPADELQRGRLGLGAGWVAQFVDQRQRRGIALAGADLQRELLRHRGRPGANRAVAITKPPRDRSGQLGRRVAANRDQSLECQAADHRIGVRHLSGQGGRDLAGPCRRRRASAPGRCRSDRRARAVRRTPTSRASTPSRWSRLPRSSAATYLPPRRLTVSCWPSVARCRLSAVASDGTQFW